MKIELYQTDLFFLELQYHNFPLPFGSNRYVFLPKAPEICALVLLTVITKSHISISEVKPFRSLKLSILSILLIFIPFSLLNLSLSHDVSLYCIILSIYTSLLHHHIICPTSKRGVVLLYYIYCASKLPIQFTFAKEFNDKIIVIWLQSNHIRSCIVFCI